MNQILTDLKKIDSFDKYLRNIKLTNGDDVMTSKWRTGFVGFLVGLNSFRLMFEEYVRDKKIFDCIPTYRFSQDHVETFFGAIRAKCGSNNNPTVSQFVAAYKRLLTNNDVSPSDKTNCRNFNDTIMLAATTVKKSTSGVKSCSVRSDEGPEFAQKREEIVNMLENDPKVQNAFNDIFIAATVQNESFQVQKVVLKKLNCGTCIQTVISGTQSESSKDVLTVCKVTDFAFRVLVDSTSKLDVSKYFTFLVDCTISRIAKYHSDLFGNLICKDHRIELIKLIIDVYLQVLMNNYTKSIIPFKKPIRSTCTKLILFSGQ